MRIRDVLINNFNDLPGYKLKGYAEVAVPFFQRKVEALSLVKRSLPVVEEFILNFYNEGLLIEEIALILSIEEDIIQDAFFSLMQRDYINPVDRSITNNGKRYLIENKLDILERTEFVILVDGFTGKVIKNNDNLMVNRKVKENGIRALRPSVSMPEIDEINFANIKKIFNKYKKDDDGIYSGELLEIIGIRGNTTKYKKIDIMIFENEEHDVRIIAFDEYSRLVEYEESLKELDLNGTKLLSYKFENFFKDSTTVSIDNILIDSKIKEVNVVQYKEINNIYEQNLCNRRDQVIIVIPLVSDSILKGGIIDEIEKNVNEGLNLTIVLSGKDYVDEYQKKLTDKLVIMTKKYKTLKVLHTPMYINEMILNLENCEAIVTKYNENSINLSSTKDGILESFYNVKGEAFDKVHMIVNSHINHVKELKNKLRFSNKDELKKKMAIIAELVRDLDGYMTSNDNVGWIGKGDIPELHYFLELPLANDSKKFKLFIDYINKSLVESLEINGKNNGKKNYFWNEFKTSYPKLYKSLSRIKVYRNKASHFKLTDSNEKTYTSFLDKDLDGCIPDLIQDGYLILQYVVVIELENAIKDVMNDLK
ncbi:hypothetical protein TPDSL_15320 [Terrisporobacter petrolearius]|uniref:hypothetical protein n=1 Tax=Terrisporobacter petrolearius TaxID=1460447 RepID=UPI0033699AD9